MHKNQAVKMVSTTPPASKPTTEPTKPTLPTRPPATGEPALASKPISNAKKNGLFPPKKAEPNKSYICGNVGVIVLDDEHQALCDLEDMPGLLKFKWYAIQGKKCWYARTFIGKKPHILRLAMHRFVMRTPHGKQCHHRNRNSLDNRRANLLNMSRAEHNFLHLNNHILIKFEPNSKLHPESKSGKEQKHTPKSPLLENAL